jgi:hypothetical protein
MAVSLAAVLALACPNAKAAKVDESSTMEINGPSAVLRQVDQWGKPLVVLVCNDCAGIAALFTQEAAKHPELVFRTGTPTDWGIPTELLPFVVVVTPKCGITRRMVNYSPTTIEAVDFFIKHFSDGEAFQTVTRTCQ